jgi:hypothetical protein
MGEYYEFLGEGRECGGRMGARKRMGVWRMTGEQEGMSYRRRKGVREEAGSMEGKGSTGRAQEHERGWEYGGGWDYERVLE